MSILLFAALTRVLLMVLKSVQWALPFASLTRVLLIAVYFAVDAWGASTPRLGPACHSALLFLCAALHVFEGANVGFLSSLYI